MNFLVVENLDDSDQFILRRDFNRNVEVTIDLNNGLIRLRNPDRNYVMQPVNRILTNENMIPICLTERLKYNLGRLRAD